MVTITSAILAEITGRDKGDFGAGLVFSLNRCCIRYGITSVLRQAHFLGQTLHESMGYRRFREIASGEAYEGRRDLGNIHPGDGKKFLGRGAVQLTGRYWAKMYSDHTGEDFISEPERLETTPHSILSAGWYWEYNNLNELADRDDTTAITRRINGGLNGYDERVRYTEKAKEVLYRHEARAISHLLGLESKPPETIPVDPPEVPRELDEPRDDTTLFLFDKRPKWIGFSRVTLGAALAVVGFFGGNWPVVGALVQNWEGLLVTAGLLVTLVGRLLAKRPVYLWPKSLQRLLTQMQSKRSPAHQ